MKEFEIGWNNGINVSVKDTNISLDPQCGVNLNGIVLISHAHSDHIKGFESKSLKMSTQETLELYKAKTKCQPVNTKNLVFLKNIKYDNFEIVPYNAGHMLGSAQFLIKTPYGNIGYTGDINCLDTLTTEAANVIDCDILIMEATYGDPFYKFPDREETYNEIVGWALKQIKAKHIPIFQSYSTGKAQEIVALFNNFTNLPVVVDSSINRTSRVYGKFGCKLIFLSDDQSEGKEILRKGECIYVVSKSHKAFGLSNNFKKATVTGWALKFNSTSDSFPLSSHADYIQLMDYVKTVKPSKVFTCFGFDKVLAQNIKKEYGITALPLPQFEQPTLKKFWRS